MSFSIKPTPPPLPLPKAAPAGDDVDAAADDEPATAASDGRMSHGLRRPGGAGGAGAAGTGGAGCLTVLMRVRIVSAGWETMAPATPAVMPATMETLARRNRCRVGSVRIGSDRLGSVPFGSVRVAMPYHVKERNGGADERGMGGIRISAACLVHRHR